MSDAWDDMPTSAAAASPSTVTLDVVVDDWDTIAVTSASPDHGADKASADLPAEAATGSGDDGAHDNVDDQVIVLDPRPSASAVRDSLIKRVAAGDDVTIEASAVERLPVPVIQVLLAAIRELGAQNRRLIVRNPSFSFSLAFEALGFGPDREVFTVEYC